MSMRAREVETPEAEEIAELLTTFLREYPECVLLEGGEAVFDFAEADHTVTCSQGKVVLHAWSDRRNQVRRITAAVRRGRTLRLKAQRFGQKEPESLELVADRGVRAPATQEGTRERYRRLLERVLRREFAESELAEMRTAMDLEHSFGPAYARGLQVRGQRAWAVVGVGAGETVATIDGVLTIGILWLAHCRERTAGRRVVEGLRVVLPPGRGETTLARMAWMDERIAQYALYELNEATEALAERDVDDRGNVATRLLRAGQERDAAAPGGRFAEAIPRVLALLPERPQTPVAVRHAAHSRERALPGNDAGYEMRLRSNAELAFLRYGTEFARIRAGFGSESFNRELEVTVGSGEQETVLTDANAPAMREMVHELFARRATASAGHGTTMREVNRPRDPLFRMQPERWLESLLRADLPALDAQLLPEPAYVQVPMLAGVEERGTLDLLALTTEHRLAVIEVKVEEDLHFAMQGLDYWLRVREHHLARLDPTTGLSDLQQQGYFPETRLLPEPPMLTLVAPALRIHPATETVLRHLKPGVRWTLIALDERWRTRIRPVWRKRSRGAGDGR